MDYLPGDLVFVRSNGIMPKLIRFFEGRRDRGTARVNHVAVIDPRGDVPFVVDAAIPRVRFREFTPTTWRNSEVLVYRSASLPQWLRIVIALRAHAFVNARYDVLKLVAHALDWCLGGRFVFRRMTNPSRGPICSFIAARAYRNSGVLPPMENNAPDPEDIYRAVTASADWVLVEQFTC